MALPRGHFVQQISSVARGFPLFVSNDALLSMADATGGWQRCRAAFGVYKTIRRNRSTAAARAIDRLKQQMENDLLDAGVTAVTLAATACDESARRTELRALGKWRGSTLSGYLRNDEKSRKDAFRASDNRLDTLVALLQDTKLAGTGWRNVLQPDRGRRVTRKATEALDPPTLRYKVATCLYAFAHGGTLKTIADAASIGKSTLKGWLDDFSDGVTKRVKPLYMPGTPWDPETLAAVRGQFASRRGIDVACLACDGSHIPFRPKNKRIAMDYRNYKGWTSILLVGFVDSFYRFFILRIVDSFYRLTHFGFVDTFYRFYEVDVGYPGRAGDNTVLARNGFMRKLETAADTYLGVGGLILGDSGASDGDRIFINPYHAPTTPERCWFNFCHSSTRFFVEQTFGMWKNRFRFLLHGMPEANHKLMTKMIYASTVLHNFFLADPGDEFETADPLNDPCWKSFFEKHKAHMCPTCKREGKAHCIHQAAYRQGAAQVKAAREAPSDLRDALCEKLWREVCAGPGATEAMRTMGERATNGFA